MMSRRRYNYTCGDFTYNLLCCCKCLSRDNTKPYSFYNRHKLYEKGIDKFNSEFDAEHFVKSLRNLKILIASLMDDSERFMVTFQQRNALHLIQKDSDSESDEDAMGKKIPKMITNNTVSVENHKDRIKEFCLAYYSEQLTDKDFKLLNGVFSKRTLKNDELEYLNANLEGDINPSQQINPEFSKSHDLNLAEHLRKMKSDCQSPSKSIKFDLKEIENELDNFGEAND